MREVWLDMNLPIAAWLESRMGFPCRHFSQIGLQTASDHEVFRLAREADAVIFTKDADFAHIIRAAGQPPQIVWIRFGNVTSRRFESLLTPLVPHILASLRAGEPLIEITER